MSYLSEDPGPDGVWEAIRAEGFSEIFPFFDPWAADDIRTSGGSYFFSGSPGVSVTPVASSRVDGGSRLDTIVARFPRFVLPEVNTHRVFSRNSASSRARSLQVTITEVMQDPVVPIFTQNQRGMSGKLLEGEELVFAQNRWLDARDAAVASALSLAVKRPVLPEDVLCGAWRDVLDYYRKQVYPYGGGQTVHKQNVNRILEPFMWHESVISSTTWDNFYHLRIHPSAQPEIVQLARLCKFALNETPVQDDVFHSPFVDGKDKFLSLLESAGHCAQVSYRSVLGDVRDTFRVARSLAENEHYSPFEHPAMHVSVAEKVGVPVEGRNFSSDWVQLRVLAEQSPECLTMEGLADINAKL